MSQWGNADRKASNTGTVAITGAAVTGTSTLFDAQANIGDWLHITDTGAEGVVLAVASNTALTLDRSMTTVAANTFTLSEKPREIIVGNSSLEANAVFGVDTTEMGVSGLDADTTQHAGWVKVVNGTGPVNSVLIVDGGADFAPGDTITFAAPELSGVTATATLTITANAISAVVMVLNGAGYNGVNAAPFALTSSAGGGDDLTVNFGGRVGRRTTETLVAMGSITGDAEDAIFPDS